MRLGEQLLHREMYSICYGPHSAGFLQSIALPTSVLFKNTYCCLQVNIDNKTAVIAS